MTSGSAVKFTPVAMSVLLALGMASAARAQSATPTQALIEDTFVFNLGATVDSKLKYRVYELAYEYAFLHEPSYEVAASLGVHYTDLSLQLSGVASFTDANGSTTTSFSSKQSSVPVPLPVIGVRGLWAVALSASRGTGR